MWLGFLAFVTAPGLIFTFIIQSFWVAGGLPSDPQSQERQWRSTFVPYFRRMLADPQYLKLRGAGGQTFSEPRPLVYWFETPRLADPVDGFGPNWQTEIAYFIRQIDSVPGLGPPFFVDVNMNTGALVDFARADGQEFIRAVSSYGPAGARPGDGRQCWSAQAAADEANRNRGVLTVPGLTPVNDNRPRQPANYGFSYGFWSQPPTYGQWLADLRSARNWLSNHLQQTTDPPVSLIYAWNEIDEGGGIQPTRQDGTKYLDAVDAVATGRLPTTYDDVLNGDNCAISLVGRGWQYYAPSPSQYDSDDQISLAYGDYAELSWANTVGFEVSAVRGPNRGRMEVYIDGVLRSTVELNSPTWQVRQVVFSDFSLARGRHVLRLRNVSPSGYQMGIDSIRARVRRVR
jgi:hypothetical protein